VSNPLTSTMLPPLNPWSTIVPEVGSSIIPKSGTLGDHFDSSSHLE